MLLLPYGLDIIDRLMYRHCIPVMQYTTDLVQELIDRLLRRQLICIIPEIPSDTDLNTFLNEFHGILVIIESKLFPGFYAQRKRKSHLAFNKVDEFIVSHAVPSCLVDFDCIEK